MKFTLATALQDLTALGARPQRQLSGRGVRRARDLWEGVWPAFVSASRLANTNLAAERFNGFWIEGFLQTMQGRC